MHPSHLIRVEKIQQIEPYHFCKLSPFKQISVHGKVTLKNATPKEVNTPIGRKIVGCVSLNIGKWIIFLQFLKFISFGNIHKVRTL